MKEKPIIERNYSGEVYIKGDSISWIMPNDDEINVNLVDVRVIGEYTTDDGPTFDDWFLTFVYSDGTWDDISIYANNIDEVREYLAKRFDLETSYCLTNSTKWNSCILYPKDLFGKKLFEMTKPKDYKEPQNLMDHIKLIFGIGKYGKPWYFKPTAEVQALLPNSIT